MQLQDNAWPPSWSAAAARQRRRFDWLALAPGLFLAGYVCLSLAEAAAR